MIAAITSPFRTVKEEKITQGELLQLGIRRDRDNVLPGGRWHEASSE